jgi:hypothetical protein
LSTTTCRQKKWDIEKIIAMCVQEEDRLKASYGGSTNYVKDNKKKEVHSKQPKFFKATWKRSLSASASAKTIFSGQRYISPL